MRSPRPRRARVAGSGVTVVPLITSVNVVPMRISSTPNLLPPMLKVEALDWSKS